ncbi:AIPR family protein [Paenibacillus sp. FSL R7-0204]|uniref:AIPR family protein n=1 Tax=Paenibacillus sp. FSL R7-0204 TaxID=2921675 RepID=UPI0030F86A0D
MNKVDRITKSLIDDFSKVMELETKDQSKLFEMFATYSILSKHHSEKFELDDVVGGEGGDCGIDGLAIIFSGVLVNTLEEIDDILERSGIISEVNIILVQSKTSASFDGGEMRTFGDGVVDFFSENPTLVRNDFIQKKALLVEKIISIAAKVKKITCKMFYVTTGKWLDDQNLLSRISKIQEDIENLSLFKEISFSTLGAKEIQKYYRETQERVSATIKFQNKVLIPDIDGVQESYIGTLELKEFLNIIIDDLGNIKRGIFYDNVRDFQGENDVNVSIEKTLRSSKSGRLAVLNNGITIVTKSLTVARNDFSLEDYQIVNGCQTSHVIYNNRDIVNKDISLPIKIIVPANDEVINDIIIANNSQTEVKKEELMALSDFQKNLELFYNTIDDPKKRLFYERRSKQYDSDSGIERVRIVTISSQVRSFASMFLDKPHLASRFYGQLLEELRDVAFLEDHELLPYYTSSYALYKLEFYFRNKNLDSKYRKFKYHILMMLKNYTNNEKVPPFNSKKVNKLSEEINKILYNSNLLDIFKELTSIIEEVVEDINDTETTKRISLNKELVDKLQELKKETV